MTDCDHKARFASKEFAEQVVREHQAQSGYRAKHGMQHRAYYCFRHACWHTGNSTSAQHIRSITPGEDATAILQRLRRDLIAEYGRHMDPEVWVGVRRISGAIVHLTRHP